MSEEQWRLAWEMYAKAVDFPPEQRHSVFAGFISDPEVLDEVTSMLAEAHTGSDGTPNKLGLRIGSRFGRYQVGEMLSSGGMGEVYAADDPELNRKVAIKFLHPEVAAGDRAVNRLIREAKAASALNHPHIITVYEVIRAKDDVAIAMELVQGRALREFCRNPVEVAELIHWGRQIAQALAAAHQRNIIHRDVKPENLMVRDDGILKVLDFGIAGFLDGEEQRSTGDLSGPGGTLNYMSPEQTRGERGTGESDVFSLGVVLYELATGEHPFRRLSPIETAHAIALAEPKPPSSLNRRIPAKLDALLLSMLSKDARKRPSAAEIDEQLSLAAPGKSSGRSRAVAGAACVGVLAIAGIWAYASQGKQAENLEPKFVQLTRQVNENRVTAAAISADGKTLLFSTLAGSVYRRRTSDGHTRPLTALRGMRIDRMVWFKDGSKVLIDGSMVGASDKYEPGVWVMSAEGARLTNVVAGAKSGAPSPDGSRIAFTNTDGSILSVASITGGNPRQIRSGGETTTFSSIVWSPDGKRIAFQRIDHISPAILDSDPGSFLTLRDHQYSYESVAVDSGQTVASAKDFVMESACGLVDGSLLFLRNTIEQPLVYRLWKLRTDPQTGRFLEQPRLLNREDYNLQAISASADGTQLVTIRSINGHPNIYLADLIYSHKYPRFSSVRRLTFTDADEFPHAWTPDGGSVIFESFRNGNFDLFRQEIDQTDAQPIEISNNPKVLPHVSPDGKWLLYNRRDERSKWSVMRMPMEGGRAETVLPEMRLQGEYDCASNASGRCVARAIRNDQFIFTDLDPVLGRGRELARTGLGPAVIGDWSISPDGAAVAIPNHNPRNAKIRIVPLDPPVGTVEKTVTIKMLKNLSGVVWAADGRGWYVSVQDTNRGMLFYVDLQGQVMAKLIESMAPTYAVPSPDGRRVAFMDWTASANVWQVQGP